MTAVKGDFNVSRTLTVGRRTNEGMNVETLVATKTLVPNDAKFQNLSAALAQAVILPDATTLPNGWSVIVSATGAASLNVTDWGTTGADGTIRKNILPARSYEVILFDNSTTAGVWFFDFKEEADLLPSSRYASTFNAIASWGTAAGGLYTITITAATHLRGASPEFEIFETIGGVNHRVLVSDASVAANGDVSISVSDSPDARFAGKIVFI